MGLAFRIKKRADSAKSVFRNFDSNPKYFEYIKKLKEIAIKKAFIRKLMLKYAQNF